MGEKIQTLNDAEREREGVTLNTIAEDAAEKRGQLAAQRRVGKAEAEADQTKTKTSIMGSEGEKES